MSFYAFGSQNLEKFNKKLINKLNYKIRIVSSNINIDRFYNNIDSVSAIEELIEMSLPKSQPPEEIGEGPTWEVRASKPKNNKKRYNKNKKKNFKPRKPGGEKNKA